MLFLLSPAKALNFERALPEGLPATKAQFLSSSAELVRGLRTAGADGLAALMDLSPDLAALNAKRFQQWRVKHDAPQALAAVLAFDGDVYDGLQASDCTVDDLEWLQRHLRILSGLYGLLRPLDAIRPHRLEMGTRWANARGSNLYQFWGARLAQALNPAIEAAGEGAEPVLVNLASQEYARGVDRRALRHPVFDCVFEEQRGTQRKVISFSAKRARGQMVRFALRNRLTQVRDLQEFAEDGYQFMAADSDTHHWVFCRPQPVAVSGGRHSGA